MCVTVSRDRPSARMTWRRSQGPSADASKSRSRPIPPGRPSQRRRCPDPGIRPTRFHWFLRTVQLLVILLVHRETLLTKPVFMHCSIWLPFSAVERKHAKHTFKCLLYCTLSICVSRFQSLKSFFSYKQQTIQFYSSLYSESLFIFHSYNILLIKTHENVCLRYFI